MLAPLILMHVSWTSYHKKYKSLSSHFILANSSLFTLLPFLSPRYSKCQSSHLIRGLPHIPTASAFFNFIFLSSHAVQFVFSLNDQTTVGCCV